MLILVIRSLPHVLVSKQQTHVNNTHENTIAHKRLVSNVLVISWRLTSNITKLTYKLVLKYLYKITNHIHHMRLVHTILIWGSLSYSYIQWANNWTSFVWMVESCRHEIIIKSLKWEKPYQPFFQLNTDGSAFHNPGWRRGNLKISRRKHDICLHHSFGNWYQQKSRNCSCVPWSWLIHSTWIYENSLWS